MKSRSLSPLVMACATLALAAAGTPAFSTSAAAQTAAPAQAAAPAPVATWKLDTPERPAFAGSSVRETVWSAVRPPSGPFDRIALHRYRAQGPVTATLLYLPGTNMNGVIAVKDEAHNLWLYLASRGVEVFALDYRTHFIPAATPATALDSLRTWSTDAFVGDIRAAAAQARQESGRPQLYVAGFSRGVILAYAYANVEPDQVAGLVLLDGPFKSYAPKNQFDAEAALQKLEGSKAWGTDVAGPMGFDNRQKLMDAVAANPAVPASDAKFKTLGDQLAAILQFAWRPGGLANPLGGVSKPQVLATLLGGYDQYYPAVQDVDGRAIADYDNSPRTAVDDLWGKMPTPILLFSSTGMGGDWLLNAIYSAEKSGSKDVTYTVLERYGHLDVLVGDSAQKDVFDPALQWIKAHAAAKTPPTSALR